MRILFVADGRSPIALNWIRYFIHSKDEVYLVSTFPCPAEPGLAGLELIPVAFSQAKGQAELKPGKQGARQPKSRLKELVWGAGLVGLRTGVRQWLGPLTLPAAARQLEMVISRVQPDLVHAMRIPYEGMLSTLALASLPEIPLLISVWGNDFTLHGRSNPWMGWLTRRVMRRTDALHTDCVRDQRLAFDWNFDRKKPAIVLPGNGGIDLQVFHPAAQPPGELLVVNPRGVRAYVRNDTFFKAVPLVLQALPETHFACLGMAGDPYAERWLRQLGIENQVQLLPKIPRVEVAELFRGCAVAVSPTNHDGTPNTLLEAMASGCFPVVGDIASLREWIIQGENGFLVDPGDPAALAQAMINALSQPGLRQNAQSANQEIIVERAEYQHCMQRARAFYRQLCCQMD
jgi:glycosyltransferase involved in cell wall biosynthesis